ncbi:hypothetical protein [Halomonas sp. 328]|uniref:hypothetical protein n=1 Tax=Halomonas sp. 328 TaxID=2776704 RepID=UPI0018A74EB0|nr:hypothetical protein [Halomonas sp. 328]MBF8222634.1 hypothetical protein [Halomonas sp. 328]
MINEPQRLQYLEAMGLTAWTARYRLPGAAETPACDWPEEASAPAQAPQARLQALLQEPVPRREVPEATPGAPNEPAPRGMTEPGPGRAKALLGEAPQAPAAKPSEAQAQTPPAESTSAVEPRQALRFSVQLMALEGRWLLLLPEAPDAAQQRLLNNLGRAAGLPLAAPALQRFDWPLMEGLPVEAPLEEAREGLKAFIAGRGWRPERLLAFGLSPELDQVLAIDGEQSEGLGLPAWQGPSLAELAGDAEAKRALWPRLFALGRDWADDGDA